MRVDLGQTALSIPFNQQPPLKEVVCKPRPIGAYDAAKATKKRNILKTEPYPITTTKGGGFSSSKQFPNEVFFYIHVFKKQFTGNYPDGETEYFPILV